jgi:membrane protease YdiL (CAAX protease family)
VSLVRAGHSSLAARSLPANVAAGGRVLVLVALIGVAVGLRTEIFRNGLLDGVTEGLVFGSSWLGIALVGGLRWSRPDPGALAGGLAAGLALLALPLAFHPEARSVVLGHAAGFWPWVAATSVVACAEESVLRGSLWRAIATAAGEPAALVATSVLFALIHVPIYGMVVVPLDLGVGLVLGGLRLWFGGMAAPAVAHLVADLGTWWL